jgi:hypothetical protein
MKNIMLLICCAVLITACRKSSSPARPIYLSKIMWDGEPLVEYVYNNDGQLIVEKSYDEYPGNTDLVYESRYTYDDLGKLKEMRGYQMPENKLSSICNFELGKEGNVTRIAMFSMSGPDSGKIQSYQDYKYNTDGRVVRITSRDKNEDVLSYREFDYFKNGNLRLQESYTQSGGGFKKSFGRSYSAGDTTLPATFYTVRAFPINYYYPWLVSSYVESSIINNGQITERYGYTITDREFNSRGLVKKQTITLKSLLTAVQEKPKVEEYEYVEK